MIYRFTFMVIFFFSQISLISAKTANTDQLFGAPIKWTADKKESTQIKKFLDNNKKSLQGTFDPDCVYKKLGNKYCGKNINKGILSGIERLSKELAKETDGAFSHIIQNKRDFAAVSQGYILDMLKTQTKGKSSFDFSGDIYFSNKSKKKVNLTVMDSIHPGIPFAKVEMNDGWMITSALSNRTRHKKNIKSFDMVKRVVLFGSKNIEGARLDAWSTAIIAGGLPVIRKLRKNKKYNNLWGYMYFDMKDKAVCSPNINCNFIDKNKRLITMSL